MCFNWQRVQTSSSDDDSVVYKSATVEVANLETSACKPYWAKPDSTMATSCGFGSADAEDAMIVDSSAAKIILDIWNLGRFSIYFRLGLDPSANHGAVIGSVLLQSGCLRPTGAKHNIPDS